MCYQGAKVAVRKAVAWSHRTRRAIGPGRRAPVAHVIATNEREEGMPKYFPENLPVGESFSFDVDAEGNPVPRAARIVPDGNSLMSWAHRPVPSFYTWGPYLSDLPGLTLIELIGLLQMYPTKADEKVIVEYDDAEYGIRRKAEVYTVKVVDDHIELYTRGID